VSGAWAADLPLSAQAYFVTPALRSAASRSRSAPSQAFSAMSAHRSAHPDFWPLRSISAPLSAHMRCAIAPCTPRRGTCQLWRTKPSLSRTATTLY